MKKAISRKRDFSKITVNGQPLEVLSVLGIEVPVWRDPEKGDVWIFLRPVVEQLGLSWQGQHVKVMGEDARKAYQDTVKIFLTVSPHQNNPEESISREALFIQRRGFLLWLASLNPRSTRIPEELDRFQLEVMDALDRYFSEGVAVNPAAYQAAPQQVTSNFAKQAASVLSPQEKLKIAKEGMELLLKIAEVGKRPPNAHVLLLAEEAIGSALREIGQSSQKAPRENLWAVEDLRKHFPEIREKTWVRYRSALGKALKKRGLSPVGLSNKLINGNLREVHVYKQADYGRALSIARSYFQSKGLL